MNYKIYPVFLGSAMKPSGEDMYLYPAGETFELPYTCHVIKGGDEVILVDAGLPSQETIRKEKKPFMQMDNAPTFEEGLAKVGVKISDVTKIIITHLHWDHSWNLDLFGPEVPVYVQRKEMEFAIAPLKFALRLYGRLRECGMPGWLNGLFNIQVLDGDAQIAPGVEVLFTPGHTPGSQCVLVDTADGKYIFTGDTCPCFENFEQMVPPGIHHNLEDWYKTHARIKATGAKLIPSHEIKIFDQSCYG
ncbi:N-acyl homoserine lactonase family protein [Youxingia wuxianensis]|uniref:N-acyl homoserine lactonase family protein n=1 Tax=Youxingia wuxianensis TaxID=2763678 RepID=A0A926IGP5_9FIRM|nr:N-acyl homoserine lactonase family protein [Youxingia wuxianensis]MBC8584310.1 N-acyl homoserine lactonase family protein [Youxingia wuxianensis]